MANLRVHLLGAALTGTAVATASWLVLGIPPGPALAALVLTVVGGLLPDVDHDKAVPYRQTFEVLSAVIPAITAPVLVRHGLPPGWTIPYVAAVYLIVRFPVARLFMRVTVHRGILHSVPAALLAGTVTALALRTYAIRERLALGAAITLGVVAHLVLDEAYAVDYTGRQLKQSFGTALKLHAPSVGASLACWLALFLAVGLLLMDLGTGRIFHRLG
jgi:membrane-bound metal-dependent hydrolase YbcI (DUF457 family)